MVLNVSLFMNCGAMSIIQNIISCMRGYRSSTCSATKSTKIKFGVPLTKLSQKSSQHLPKPLFDLLVYLAQEGIKTNDLFRKPGNSMQIKKIIDMLSEGCEIDWSNYNLYTAANVAKKYFISLPEGLFGRKFELILLNTYSSSDDSRRATFHRILRQLPNANRELAILMFGILFRMVSHAVDLYSSDIEGKSSKTRKSDTELMLAEAVAKSVAGSIFHLCTSSPENVEKAATVLQRLILDFPSFDEEYVDFYYRSTLISFRDKSQSFLQFSEKFEPCIKELKDPDIRIYYPGNIPECKKVTITQEHMMPTFTLTNPLGDEENMSTDSSPIFKKKYADIEEDDISLRSCRSSGYDKVQQRQLEVLQIRSDWFLNSSSCTNISFKPSQTILSQPYYESNAENLSLSTDNIQFQIIASSGPDILQTTQNIGRHRSSNFLTADYSYNLKVPNMFDADSFQSSQVSSFGNISRGSFNEDAYSDYQ